MNIHQIVNDFGCAQTKEKPLDNIISDGGFCGIIQKIGCIGDSLSSGEFESFQNGARTCHDFFNYSWGQFMARDIGCCVYNFSRGGMSAKQYGKFALEKGFYNHEYACQAYIIALGVNDVTEILKGESEIGTIDDIDLSDYAKSKPTFAGFYARIISEYKMIQPKAKFFLMTLPRGEDKERTEYYDKHAEILRDISKLFDNCYVLDFRKYAPVYDEEFKQKFFLAGHMNAAGYRLTALMVESYIDYIIRRNPEDFKQIGFVGTPVHNANAKW